MALSAPHTRFYAEQYRLKVSPYDRASSVLIALLILLGAAVLILLIIWLSTKIFLGQAAVPVEILELGTGEGAPGGGPELDGPTDEEIGEETDLEEPALRERLAAIDDAVGAVAAMLEDPLLSDQMKSGRGGGSRGDGRGVGAGSGTGSGQWRRWEVRFIEGKTLEAYARQLDWFRIELGVLKPGNRVEYAYNLSQPRPDKRVGAADQEKRYYLTWQSGDLQEADLELLSRAGIDSQGRLILKLLPAAVEARLAELERIRAGPDAKVRRTRFGIRQDGSGYRFYVIDQSYR